MFGAVNIYRIFRSISKRHSIVIDNKLRVWQLDNGFQDKSTWKYCSPAERCIQTLTRMPLRLSRGCFSGLMQGCKGDRPARSGELEQRVCLVRVCVWWIPSHRHRLKNSCRRLLWNPSLCGLWIETSGGNGWNSFFFLSVAQSNAQGTVPYLGIFLTDLTMLDTAVKDRLDVSDSHLYLRGKPVATHLEVAQCFTIIKLNWTHILSSLFCRTATSTSTKGEGWVSQCASARAMEGQKFSLFLFLSFFLSFRSRAALTKSSGGLRSPVFFFFFPAALTLQKKSSKVHECRKKKNPVREKKPNRVRAIKRGERETRDNFGGIRAY